MNSLERQKLKEVVLYILNITGGLDYYRVFKVLYFAEKEHLKLYGTRIVADNFAALPYGPVPSVLYDAVKANLYTDVITRAGDDASMVLLPKRNFNSDYLSQSDILCLNRSIQENAKLSFSEMMEKSHDTAWQKARQRSGFISLVEMARAAGASEEMLDYIEEQSQIENSLS